MATTRPAAETNYDATAALSAPTLCDAFQNGGTMEIRFDTPVWLRVNGKQKMYEGHPEGRVPASLRRELRELVVVVQTKQRELDERTIQLESLDREIVLLLHARIVPAARVSTLIGESARSSTWKPT